MATNHQTQTTDSVITRQVVRDTTVIIKADSSMIQALIECDSLGQAHIKELYEYQQGERLRPPTVIIRDNILTATARTDSLRVKISWLEMELERYKNTAQIATNTQYIEVNRLTWWQTLWVWLGRISAAAIVLLVTYKVIRNYVK